MREQERHWTGTSGSHTKHRARAIDREGFSALNPIPQSCMFASFSVGSILRSYLLESLRSYDGDGGKNTA